MKPVSSLLTKILCWFFLNMVLVTAGLTLFFAYQPHVDLHAIFGQQVTNRLRSAGMLLAHDLDRIQRTLWADMLSRHAKIHGVDFTIILGDGSRFSSTNEELPAEVFQKVEAVMRHKPPMDRLPPPHEPGGHRQRPQGSIEGPSGGRTADEAVVGAQPPPEPDAPRHLPQNHDLDSASGRSDPAAMNGNPLRPPQGNQSTPHLMMRTRNPTRYWSGIRLRLTPKESPRPIPAVLLAVSDSKTGNGFFFDPLPWMVVAAVVIFISVLLWIPMVRNISGPLARMTRATESISKGHFDVTIQEPRTDEIGRLAKAISYMAKRLSAFVKGQKRFLGDVAHELGSPIARIQFGLGALEQRVEKEHRRRVIEVMEDVNLMSKLVNELLAFSRADMMSTAVQLERIALFPVVQAVVKRETTPQTNIKLQIDPNIRVVASPDLLTRALANLLRNAIKYAGEAGPIEVIARANQGTVDIEVRDQGPGVPEDLLHQLFEPFFRPEASRDRDSGGVGLGLAIVKTCIDACKGTVIARNILPKGFAVTMTLQADLK